MRSNRGWLVEYDDIVKCPICLSLLKVPTTVCPQGHAVCRDCYVAELAFRKKCPLCKHPAGELRRCRPFEDLIRLMESQKERIARVEVERHVEASGVNPSTLTCEPWTLNPEPGTRNPQPSTLNPQPYTLQ